MVPVDVAVDIVVAGCCSCTEFHKETAGEVVPSLDTCPENVVPLSAVDTLAAAVADMVAVVGMFAAVAVVVAGWHRGYQHWRRGCTGHRRWQTCWTWPTIAESVQMIPVPNSHCCYLDWGGW